MFTCDSRVKSAILWHREFDDVDLLDFVAFLSEHCGDVNLILELSDCRLFFVGFDTVSTRHCFLSL